MLQTEFISLPLPQHQKSAHDQRHRNRLRKIITPRVVMCARLQEPNDIAFSNDKKIFNITKKESTNIVSVGDMVATYETLNGLTEI